MLICTNCGASFTSKEKFCPICGYGGDITKESKMKKIIIAEAKLVEAMSRSNLFFADDKERGLYINLDVASRAAKALKPYVGQIVTISVEIPEQQICCSPDFEERVREIVRAMLKKAW